MILVCAATRTEAAACLRGIAEAGAPEFEVLRTGVGPSRAADALRDRLARGATARPAARPTLVVSSGFAGALTPGVERLEWITAGALYRIAAGAPIAAALPRELLRVADGVTRCDVVSADAVVARPVPGGERPVVADMESSALAEVAGAAGIAFMALRLITDTPAHPLGGLGRSLAATLAARGLTDSAVNGARAALEAARSPRASVTFVRDALAWRDRLRAGWREHARRGLPCSPLPRSTR